MAENFKRLRLIHRDNAPDFGVEQNWLLDWYRCYTNHFKATLEELNEWLGNEYTSEDSYELYADALLADALIIQENYEEGNPQYVYVVREVSQNGLDVDARILCVSLDFNKAKNYYTDVKEDLLFQMEKGESDFSAECDKVDVQEYEHGKAYFEVSAEDEPISYYLSLERHQLA